MGDQHQAQSDLDLGKEPPVLSGMLYSTQYLQPLAKHPGSAG
jgi:hypothetical protein